MHRKPVLKIVPLKRKPKCTDSIFKPYRNRIIYREDITVPMPFPVLPLIVKCVPSTIVTVRLLPFAAVFPPLATVLSMFLPTPTIVTVAVAPAAPRPCGMDVWIEIRGRVGRGLDADLVDIAERAGAEVAVGFAGGRRRCADERKSTLAAAAESSRRNACCRIVHVPPLAQLGDATGEAGAAAF